MAYGISFIQVIKGTNLQGLYTPLHVLYVGMRISHSVSKVIPRERSYINSNQTFGVVAIQIHAHSTTDIKHTLCTFHNWHYKLSPRGIKIRNRVLASRGNCLSQLHVCTLYQSNLSFNLPPTQAYPRYLTPLPSWGEGNLIISQPFKLLASQLHVNNQSVCLSVKKTIQTISLVS